MTQLLIVNWNLLTLIVAILSLIAAAILPFAQKKYEERKAKFNFRIYLKSQLSHLFSLVTYDKLEYIKPTISDNFDKEPIIYKDFVIKIRDDFKEHQNSLQPRVIFHFLNNLQKYCHHIYQIRHSVEKIDIPKLKENVLANGEKLSQKELQKVYGLLAVIDAFNSISLFHDRFGDLKSIQREIINQIWIGIKVDTELLKQQQLLINDIKTVCDNESSLYELIGISGGIYNTVASYYGKPGK